MLRSLRSIENGLYLQNKQIIDQLAQIHHAITQESQCSVTDQLDPIWYLNQYPDAAKSGLTPQEHYARIGKSEGRAPNFTTFFDTDWYLTRHPDVVASGISPREHYTRFGKVEKRMPNFGFLFDADWYSRQYPDVKKSGLPPWEHYLLFGRPEGRHPHFHAIALQEDGYQMVNIFKKPMAKYVDGRIAIHLHLFYHDLAEEFRRYLLNMPFAYDLFVSVASTEGKEHCQQLFLNLPHLEQLTIKQVPNRGRDIAPMFCTFGTNLRDYSYIAHLHGKKSLYNKGATKGWRHYLCQNLLGSEERIRRIFALMQGEHPSGLVFPQNHFLVPSVANTWLANKAMGTSWCQRLGITDVPQGYFDFPAGSMFWARSEALRPLFEAGITLDIFPEEAGQKDGTFAHCLERLLGITARHQGFHLAIIKDYQRLSWSAWRFDQFLHRPLTDIAKQMNQPGFKLIAFDIFDTLLVRPLLNPESTKSIVAARIGGKDGELYLRNRAIAEERARQRAGRDVGMKEIFTALGELTGLPSEALGKLEQMELDVEQASLVTRSGGLALFEEALASGKPVILLSDMFLPQTLIEEILRENGFDGWKAFFLSNEIGLRKDTGALYDHVWNRYSITPAEMLMIGDNERSDFQIPCDKGGVALQLLKPIELARGLPRFRTLIEETQLNADLHDELTLGLILRHNFSEASYPQIDPYSLVDPTPFNIGYSLIGPLLVGFAQWLIDTAQKDGIERLYFLSREGQLLKRVYDVWAENLSQPPCSFYLVLSRRTVSVASILNLEDIKKIAEVSYYGNTAANFLQERFGIQLSENRWREIDNLIQLNSESIIEVDQNQIDHLLPLLQTLEAEIIESAHRERIPLERYLETMGFEQSGCQAVVDVGYGATIQGYLNSLLANSIHGYYMMTDQRSTKVAKQHGVTIRGCYLDSVEQACSAPPIYLRNFELEKFLSSNDAQVVTYQLDSHNNPVACYRELSDEEIRCAELRNELQKGVENFALDARKIRRELYPEFRPSLHIAKRLYETFIEQQSLAEAKFLRQVALDDHYCGRGVVR
ncbi:MAG: rhamnan synthesis F family protein [Desulfobulbus sp.]|nr:rhamnan synthesis F family protein [Desulfobulbus sp.]